MRWLFLLVLTLNLAYFSWHMLRSPADLHADLPDLENVATIALVDELKNEALAKHSAEASNHSPVNNTDADVSAGETLNISGEKVVNNEAGQPYSEISAVQPIAAVCYTLGPFLDIEALRGLIREIKSYVVAAEFRSTEELLSTLHWVYLPPEKSRAEAIKTGRRLKANKIKDFYIIREGEKNNGISLGYFKSKTRATRLKNRVAGLGFDVQMEVMPKTRANYWLDYELAAGAEVPEELIQRYKKANNNNEISRVSRDCNP